MQQTLFNGVIKPKEKPVRENTRKPQWKRVQDHLFRYGHISMVHAATQMKIHRLSERIREINAKLEEEKSPYYVVNVVKERGKPAIYELTKDL